MSSNIKVRLRKKQYDAATDNEGGVIVFDSEHKDIYIAGDNIMTTFAGTDANVTRKGLVPAPVKNQDEGKFLSSSGEWLVPGGGSNEEYTDSPNPVLDILPGTQYHCTINVDSLTLNSIVNSSIESFIYFTVGSTDFDVVLPSGSMYAGSLTAEAGQSYVLSVLNDISIMYPIQVYVPAP
jgi:hypothetical protein